MQKIQIDEKFTEENPYFTKERIDTALAKYTDASRSKISDMIKKGCVLVNGKKPGKSYVTRAGDEIFLSEMKKILPDYSHDNFDEMNVVYEDTEIIAIDKPAEYSTYRTGNWSGKTVVDALVKTCPKFCEMLTGELGVGKSDLLKYTFAPNQSCPGVVSRLDVGTSGVMILAKSKQAAEFLRKKFASHDLTKEYHALVCGRLKNRQGVIDAPIARDPKHKYRFAAVEGGKHAVTQYSLIREYKYKNEIFSLVRVNLLTGRTHQIRVHFRAIGHPVAGDAIYGFANQKADFINRQFLHSALLKIEHPLSGEAMTFEAEYPDDIKKALGMLEHVSGGE